MGKRVYRVKKGDDFIKISRKLYGEPSYVMDLLRANPGFNWLGPGMVLRLPKMDPRLMRQRKMRRRLKLYGPPPEEPEDTMGQDFPTEEEEGLSEGEVSEPEYGEGAAAGLIQGGESLDWWNDTAKFDELIGLMEGTVKEMGLIEEGSFQSKMGEVSTTPGKASSTGQNQFKSKEGGVLSSGLSSERKAQAQTALTDEQIATLKEELEKLGLDVDVAMEELGLGESAVASSSSTTSQATGEGVDGGGETSMDEVEETSDGATKVLERPTQQSGYPQYPDELPDKYRKLQEWLREEIKQASTEKEIDIVEKMYLQMRKELNWKKRNIVSYVFGGTMGAAGLSQEVEVESQMPAWNIDFYGNEIPIEHLINYPGAEEDTFPTGKSLQAENAKDVEIGDRELILICYSGGADACLMFARDRLDEGKKINSIVLLGPTLTGGIEDGVDISSTDSNGVPIWKSIMDDLIRDGTNIIVVNDSAKPELELYKPPEPPPGEVYGKYIYMPPDSTRGHYMNDGTGTNDSEDFREDIYNILREWQNE